MSGHRAVVFVKGPWDGKRKVLPTSLNRMEVLVYPPMEVKPLEEGMSPVAVPHYVFVYQIMKFCDRFFAVPENETLPDLVDHLWSHYYGTLSEGDLG